MEEKVHLRVPRQAVNIATPMFYRENSLEAPYPAVVGKVTLLHPILRSKQREIRSTAFGTDGSNFKGTRNVQ